MRFLELLRGRLPDSMMSTLAIGLALLPVVIAGVRTCLRGRMAVDGGADRRAHGGGVGGLRVRASSGAGVAHLSFGWSLVRLRGSVACRIHSTSIMSLLLGLV